MPRPTVMEIALPEQSRMRAELRRARYGYLLALHLLLLCAAGRTPSEVARVLFCSRPVCIGSSGRTGPGHCALMRHASRPPAETAAAAHSVAHTFRASVAQDCSPCLWLVSDAVELCPVSDRVAGTPGDCSVNRDPAPLAP